MGAGVFGLRREVGAWPRAAQVQSIHHSPASLTAECLRIHRPTHVTFGLAWTSCTTLTSGLSRPFYPCLWASKGLREWARWCWRRYQASESWHLADD